MSGSAPEVGHQTEGKIGRAGLAGDLDAGEGHLDHGAHLGESGIGLLDSPP